VEEQPAEEAEKQPEAPQMFVAEADEIFDDF
jgi:hypothetical protein